MVRCCRCWSRKVRRSRIEEGEKRFCAVCVALIEGEFEQFDFPILKKHAAIHLCSFGSQGAKSVT